MIYENTLRCRMAERSGDGCAAVLYKAAGTRLRRFVARKLLSSTRSLQGTAGHGVLSTQDLGMEPSERESQ